MGLGGGVPVGVGVGGGVCVTGANTFSLSPRHISLMFYFFSCIHNLCFDNSRFSILFGVGQLRHFTSGCDALCVCFPPAAEQGQRAVLHPEHQQCPRSPQGPATVAR